MLGGVERPFVSFFVLYAAVFFGSRVAGCTQAASGANEEEDEKGRQEEEGRERGAAAAASSEHRCVPTRFFLSYVHFFLKPFSFSLRSLSLSLLILC